MQDETQISLEELERELAAEYAAGDKPAEQVIKEEANGNAQTADGKTDKTDARQELENGAKNAARGGYRITDFDSPRDKEMAVFTHAKKLSEYIFVITEKSPKKLRWSIVTRLQNASVEVVENLYHANFEREESVRIDYQKKAAVSLKLLDFYTEVARKKQAITVKQTEVIAKQLLETTKLLHGWVRSTKRNNR